MTEAFIEKLSAPFPPEDIDWRVGQATKDGKKAMVLAYITSRAVMDRLDSVFGADGWQDEYRKWGDKGVICRLSCRYADVWITREDGADESDIEATKGGISNALKRVAVKFGIGRYLYNLPTTWVDLKDRGEIYAGKGKYFDRPSLPAWALPQGYKKQAEPALKPASKPAPKPADPQKAMAALWATAKECGLSEDEVHVLAFKAFKGTTSLKSLSADQLKSLAARLKQADPDSLKAVIEANAEAWAKAKAQEGAA